MMRRTTLPSAIASAAKAFGVLPEVARERLLGSTELRELESALRRVDDPVQIREAGSNARWGQMHRRDLAAILGFNFSFSPLVARVEGNSLSPTLADGDWAVINPSAPLDLGLLCVRGPGRRPKVIRLGPERRNLGLEAVPQLGIEDIPIPDLFSTIEQFANYVKVFGRVVGVIRLQAIPKTVE